MTLAQAVKDYIDAVDAFNEFERDHPNDSTKRWDAVFDAKCLAFETLRRISKEQA